VGERGFVLSISKLGGGSVLEIRLRVDSSGFVLGILAVGGDHRQGRGIHRLEDVEFRGRAVFAVLEEISERAVPGPVARRCVTTEPLALRAVIESRRLRSQRGHLVVLDPMRFRQHPQPDRHPVHQAQQHRPRSRCVGRTDRLQIARPQSPLVALELFRGHFTPELEEGLLVIGPQRVAGQEHLGHFADVGRLQRLPAQQADSLELLGRLPALARLDPGAELGPAVEQPAAAGAGVFQLPDQPGGPVRVVGDARPRGPGQAIVVVPLDLVGQRPTAVKEQPLAQRGGFLFRTLRGVDLGGLDPDGQPSHVDARGPI
jgi:hypothetical protein